MQKQDFSGHPLLQEIHVEQIQSVDTTGVAPMPHPFGGVQRLRPDDVTEHNRREENMQNAPDEMDGLFLVPKVIE